MNFNEFFEGIGSVPGGWFLVGKVFFVIFLTLTVDLAQRRITRHLHRKAVNSKNPWDDAVTTAIRLPLSVFLWVVGINIAVELIRTELAVTLFSVAPMFRIIGIIAVLSWFLIRLIKELEKSYIESREQAGIEVDKTTAHAFAKLLRLSVIITTVLFILQAAGISISGLLAFGGVGGLAIGFAAREMLANFFGGLTIYLDRPFKVGDWIRSPDRNLEGTVEEIGLRATRIRTFDKRPVYVPNAVFNSIIVENPSRMTRRRIYETIGVRYDDFAVMPKILEEIRRYLKNHDEIDQDVTMMVNFNRFADSSLEFFIYTFTKTTEWTKFHAIKENVLIEIGKIIEKHGAEMAFPTSTIHLATPDLQQGP